MTAKQKRFVSEYLVDLNATQAAIRAGYSKRTACEQASRLLANVKISEEIAKRREKLQNKLEITQERVLEELAAVGFANAASYVEILKPGIVRIKATQSLTREQRAAIIGIKETQNGVEIKLADKVRALELLGKHLGVFDNGSAATNQENNIFEIIEESTREELDTSEIPEIEPPAEHGHDMVEQAGL